jgi:hypothetical protein
MAEEVGERYRLNVPTVSARRPRADRLESIEAELLREKAEALGRAGERLEKALQEVDVAVLALAGMGTRFVDAQGCTERGETIHDGRAGLDARLAGLRRRARTAYEHLIIQREAVGIRSHVDVERCYRVSERLG